VKNEKSINLGNKESSICLEYKIFSLFNSDKSTKLVNKFILSISGKNPKSKIDIASLDILEFKYSNTSVFTLLLSKYLHACVIFNSASDKVLLEGILTFF